MNPATIYHRPLSEFAFATDATHYVFRLRTGKGEARSCRFFYADRAAMAPELDFACLPMKKIREDRYFDWYEVRLETKLERIAYYFELSDGAETLCYFGDCYEMAGTPTRADYFQLPFNHRADRLSVPEWTKDAVVYNIFPDSFADGFRTLSGGSDGKTGLGGTIRGVTENLDYIASMGFNCIYLNPIFAAESYHRYDTLDYYQVDPHMGSKEDVRALVEKAHSLGIRVLLGRCIQPYQQPPFPVSGCSAERYGVKILFLFLPATGEAKASRSRRASGIYLFFLRCQYAENKHRRPVFKEVFLRRRRLLDTGV